MNISVLICTHDRAELLATTLASLNRAHRPAGTRLDIVVVANACSDSTGDILRDYESRLEVDGLLPLRWVEEPALGKAFALNHALRLLDAEAVAFIDDDQRVDEYFFDALTRGLECYPDTGIFCGRLVPDWTGNEPAWVHERGPYRVYPPPITAFDVGERSCLIGPGGAIPPGGNLVVRNALLRTLGNFQTELGPRGHNLVGGEDNEFIMRALERSARLRYLPEMIQYHHVDPRRLRLPSILKLAYHRSRAATRIRAGDSRLPLYMWRKAGTYLAGALCSAHMQRTRFYLVRLAAVLGEMRGVVERSGAVEPRT